VIEAKGRPGDVRVADGEQRLRAVRAGDRDCDARRVEGGDPRLGVGAEAVGGVRAE
jgi:hypothetical protein